MVQRTYYPPSDTSDRPAWEPAPDDVHTLRHGYNLADLDRLTRAALWRVWGLHLDYAERYELAWSGIAEYLYASADPPAPADLIHAGQRAISSHIRADKRHHGRSETDPSQEWRAFVRYWDDLIRRYTPGPEPQVVDRVALWQIWPRLTPTHRKVFLALAAHGDYAQAAQSLGTTYNTFQVNLSRGRREFLKLWHGEEAPSRPWGHDRRAREATYRTARRTMVRRPRPAVDRPAHELVHGRASTYTNYGCRCEPCNTAQSADSARRRHAAGTRPRKLITPDERAKIIASYRAGNPVHEIAADSGWSRASVYNAIKSSGVAAT